MVRTGLRHHLRAAAALAGCAVLAPLALAGPAGAAAGQPSSTPTGEFAFTADAYGTYSTAAGKVVSPVSAQAFLSCATASKTATNSATGASLGIGNSTSGSVTSEVSRTSSGNTSSATATSTVESVNLLGGLIKGTDVTQTATASETSGTWSATGTSKFTGLTISGKSATSNPAPNTAVSLPGIGTAYLNYETTSVNKSGASINSDAILVVITQKNSLGIPIGAEIVVGHASVTGAGPLAGTISGSAYGSSVSGPEGTSAPSYLAEVACMGATSTQNSGQGFTFSPLKIGVVTDTASGTDNASALSAITSSTVSNVSVTGILSFGGVRANASAIESGGKIRVTGKVTLSNPKLLLTGTRALPANPPANYTVKVPGGALILNRQVKSANGILVQAVYLTGKSIGTVVIGSASANAYPGG
jgi:hypothetical protein